LLLVQYPHDYSTDDGWHSGMHKVGCVSPGHRLFHEHEEIDFARIYEITQEPVSMLIKKLESLLGD